MKWAHFTIHSLRSEIHAGTRFIGSLHGSFQIKTDSLLVSWKCCYQSHNTISIPDPSKQHIDGSAISTSDTDDLVVLYTILCDICLGSGTT
jgi:hypothetical protein